MRQLSEYIARARQMPLHNLVGEAAFLSLRKVKRNLSKVYYLRAKSFGSYNFEWAPPAFAAPEPRFVDENWPIWEKALAHVMNHEFDLLASGWTKVAYGQDYKGVEGHSYKNKTNLNPENRGQVLEINSANQDISRIILKQIKGPYEFIDWHVDFKSGYRWSPSTWWEDVPYGHKPGVDIKVPWELSRMQHLPWLAYGYLKTKDEKYKIEFQNQIFDFIANNPPRFGVNWKCPMDVAIRAANWVMAFDLFRSQDLSFELEFEKVLGDSLLDHGLFIRQNFEKTTVSRDNHYLGNIAGLTYIAHAINHTNLTSEWKKLCQKELLKEARYQFHESGTNFEGSTAYHRLSSEMLCYPLLCEALHQKSFSRFENNPDLISRMIGAEQFSKVVSQPNGNIVQVGDNDSGRFFKLMPAWKDESLFENHLDTSHLSSFAKGFFENQAMDLESSIVSKSIKKSGLKTPWNYQELVDKHKLVTQSAYKKRNFPKNYSGIKKTQKYTYPIRPESLKGLQSYFYKDFGLVIFSANNFFLSFRCGPVGKHGKGGHDHNDQLSIELFLDGKSIIQDPGTYLYSPSPIKRNQYRSNKFHFLPQPIDEEMADIQSALFFIGHAKEGLLLEFKDRYCKGHCDGFGFPITREISILDDQVVIIDTGYSDRELWDLREFQNLPYSRGYGYPNQK